MKKPKHHLPATLVAAMFSEAGVTLRPGRAKAIAGALEPTLARFKPLASRLPFEAEPSWFPRPAEKTEKRK